MYWPPSVFTSVNRDKPHNSAEDFYAEEKKPPTTFSRIPGLLLSLFFFFGGLNTACTTTLSRTPQQSIDWAKTFSSFAPGLFAMTLGALIFGKMISSFKKN